MCESMRVLYNNMKEYADNNPNFALVETKFGLVALESADRSRLILFAEVVPSYGALLETLFLQIDCDISREKKRDMCSDDKAEFRRRVMPYLFGLPDEEEAVARMEEYFVSHILR